MVTLELLISHSSHDADRSAACGRKRVFEFLALELANELEWSRRESRRQENAIEAAGLNGVLKMECQEHQEQGLRILLL